MMRILESAIGCSRDWDAEFSNNYKLKFDRCLHLETDIRRLRDSADPRKNILNGKPVHLDGLPAGGILGENN